MIYSNKMERHLWALKEMVYRPRCKVIEQRGELQTDVAGAPSQLFFIRHAPPLMKRNQRRL